MIGLDKIADAIRLLARAIAAGELAKIDPGAALHALASIARGQVER